MELRTELELREAIQSLESQLRCLYGERAAPVLEGDAVVADAPGADAPGADASLVAQLEALYSEIEEHGPVSVLAATIDRLESQLRDLDSETNELEVVRAELACLRADYEGLRAERDRDRDALEVSRSGVSSLDLQVEALIEERIELERELDAWKRRSGALIRALVDGALET